MNTEVAQDLAVPGQRVNVEEHRARGIGDVRGVQGAACQVPNQPGVDGPAGKPAALRPFSRTGNALKKPDDLGPRKIGVSNQSRLFTDDVAKAFLSDQIAHVSRTATLPNDGTMERLAGGAVPQHYGLTLVGDADGGNLFRSYHSGGPR